MILLLLQSAPEAINAEIGAGDYVRFLLVLGGILLLAWLTLRYGVSRMQSWGAPTDGPIQVVSRYPLEPGKNLYIVRAGSRGFLLAASERGVQHLSDLSAEDLPAISESQPRPAESLFARLLKAKRT